MHINHKSSKQRPKKCFPFSKQHQKKCNMRTGEINALRGPYNGGTSHIYGMHYFAKIFLKFSNRPKQRQLPPVKRSSLTHLWQIDFKIYSDLWVKRFANDFRWILLKSSKIEHFPLLDTFKCWAGEELLVSKKTFNT